MMRWPVRSVAWTLALVSTGVVAGGTAVVVATASVAPIEERAKGLAERTLPAEAALQETIAAGAAAQVAFTNVVAASDPGARANALLQAQVKGQKKDAAWNRYRDLAGTSPGELRLQRRWEKVGEESQTAAAEVIGLAPTDGAFAAALADERDAATRGQEVLAEIQHRFLTPAAHADVDTVVAESSAAKRNVLAVGGMALFLFSIAGALVLRRALRFEKAETNRAGIAAIDVRRADLETQLQRGLEMESSEQGTYLVIRQALDRTAAGCGVEVLVADSSTAHFHQALSTGEEGRAACQVAAPSECPAASSGQTRIFSDSRKLDTCPYLRDRSESVWATCVPMSIAGRTTGVIHAEDNIDRPPSDEIAPALELLARKAGERIGMLRVLARSEVQAQIDRLTGLLNRRALEFRTDDLAVSDLAFAAVFADLDHFKDLNDLHGHDTGDQALRLFARVLRDSVRPNDIPARYGGEEFVVVLPDCSIVDARVVAERIRTRLADALKGTSVPPFTVSIGLAAAEPHEAVSDVIQRADGALLKAKQLGRDRVLAAGEILDPESILGPDTPDTPDTPNPTVPRDPEASPTPGA